MTDAGQYSKEVAAAWRLVAGTRALAADAPLAPPGVYSLDYLRVVHHLEAQLGRSLPLERFRMAGRPSEFVAALGATARQETPALFVLPGIGGDDPALMRLRTALAPLAVGMITYPDWPEDDPLAIDFSGLTERVAAQIERQAPAGALRLAGYSLGGLLAFAVATRLLARGREIASLGIIDSTWLAAPRWTPLWSPARFIRFAEALRRGEALPSAAHFTAKLIRRIAPGQIARVAAPRRRWPLDFGFYLRRALMMDVHLASLVRWHGTVAQDPPRLEVDAVLFRSYQHGADEPADLNWRRCLPRLRVALVHGDHHGLLSPGHVPGFVAAFLTGMGISQPPARRSA